MAVSLYWDCGGGGFRRSVFPGLILLFDMVAGEVWELSLA